MGATKKSNFISKFLVKWLNHTTPPREFPLSDFERIRYEIKPCDVLLVEGRSRVSDVIKIITQSPWSHAALYIGRLHDIEDVKLRETVLDHLSAAPDTQLIIESLLGHGTIVRALSTYETEHLRISRPKGLSYTDSQEVVRYAVSRLGVPYDVRHIFDLARFLFPWFIMPRSWRSSLFKHNPGLQTRTVCSAMIAEAFNFIQFPILPLIKRSEDTTIQLFRRNPKLCTPSDFDYSPYFEIIKYPFIDFSSHATYRLLPWHGSGTLTGDEQKMYMHPPSAHEVETITNALVQKADNTDDLKDSLGDEDNFEKTIISNNDANQESPPK